MWCPIISCHIPNVWSPFRSGEVLKWHGRTRRITHRTACMRLLSLNWEGAQHGAGPTSNFKGMERKSWKIFHRCIETLASNWVLLKHHLCARTVPPLLASSAVQVDLTKLVKWYLCHWSGNWDTKAERAGGPAKTHHRRVECPQRAYGVVWSMGWWHQGTRFSGLRVAGCRNLSMPRVSREFQHDDCEKA